MVRNIDYVGGGLAASIRNLQMVLMVVPGEVDDNVAAMTPVRQKIWLGYLTAASKYHRSLHQVIPK